MNQILRDIYRKQTSTLGKKYTFDNYTLVYEDENYKVYIGLCEPSDFLQTADTTVHTDSQTTHLTSVISTPNCSFENKNVKVINSIGYLTRPLI